MASNEGWLSTRSRVKIEPKKSIGKHRKSLPKNPRNESSSSVFPLTQNSPPPKELFTATKQSHLGQFFKPQNTEDRSNNVVNPHQARRRVLITMSEVAQTPNLKEGKVDNTCRADGIVLKELPPLFSSVSNEGTHCFEINSDVNKEADCFEIIADKPSHFTETLQSGDMSINKRDMSVDTRHSKKRPALSEDEFPKSNKRFRRNSADVIVPRLKTTESVEAVLHSGVDENSGHCEKSQTNESSIDSHVGSPVIDNTQKSYLEAYDKEPKLQKATTPSLQLSVCSNVNSHEGSDNCSDTRDISLNDTDISLHGDNGSFHDSDVWTCSDKNTGVDFDDDAHSTTIEDDNCKEKSDQFQLFTHCEYESSFTPGEDSLQLDSEFTLQSQRERHDREEELLALQMMADDRFSSDNQEKLYGHSDND